MNGPSRLGFLLFLCWTSATLPLAHAGEPYRISLTPGNALTLSAYNAGPTTKTENGPISLTMPGKEASECAPIKDERRSNAFSSADVKVLEQRADGIRLELLTNTAANGGKYQSCFYCANGPSANLCVGSFPKYTTASAEAKAGATVAIGFEPSADETNYLLDVGVANRDGVADLKVSDQTGQPLQQTAKPGTYALRSQPGATFYVNATLRAKVSHTGEFNNDVASNSSRIDIRLRRAPLLSANRGFEPFIKGGKETSSYKTVGALLIDGEMHCTATLVGPSTVLTAAHCIEGYENQLSSFKFIVGPNIVQTSFGPVEVTGFSYPDGSDPRFKFVRKTLADDIGVMYLKTPAQVEFVALHQGTPSWDSVLSDPRQLIFVGFGYDVIGGEPVGPTIKREAAWQIDGVQPRRVTFSVPRKSTCKGDSGGPAFIIDEGRLIQMAVTSGGESDCSAGFETRIDAFHPWLASRIR